MNNSLNDRTWQVAFNAEDVHRSYVSFNYRYTARCVALIQFDIRIVSFVDHFVLYVLIVMYVISIGFHVVHLDTFTVETAALLHPIV